MINNIIETINCTGCKLCEYKCNYGAISFKQNDRGFFYPQINIQKCLNCKSCINSCPEYNDLKKMKDFEQEFYACKASDNIRVSSSSGGAFTVFTDYLMNLGYGICGVSYSKNFLKAEYKLTFLKAERDEFKIAKYVQADTNNIYFYVKQKLNKGKKIFFVGTPCVVAAMKKCLTDDERKSIILCDFICHGVPSPKLWEEHILMNEKYKNSKVISYKCRSKEFGWHGQIHTIKYENNVIDFKSDCSQQFVELYNSLCIMRESCYNCKYTNFNRVGDITIADFWGIEKKYKCEDDNKGVSLVVINSQIGKELFTNVKGEFDYFTISKEDCLQPNLQKPTNRPNNIEKFWDYYKKNGFFKTANKYGRINVLIKIKRKVSKIIKKIRG